MKYLQEQVEADFWAKGCVLLDNYEGTNIPMSYICERRTYALYRSGWKSIRIISRFDKLPNKEKIIEIINYARSLISSGSKWVLFDIDNNILKSQNYNSHYNFGETKRIRNDCASCQ